MLRSESVPLFRVNGVGESKARYVIVIGKQFRIHICGPSNAGE